MKMKPLVFCCLAMLLAILPAQGESKHMMKITTTTEGDLFADSEHEARTREWTPLSDWIVPQNNLALIAQASLQEKHGSRMKVFNAELTHVFWTRSFEGWWFLQIQFLIRSKESSPCSGAEMKSIYLLPDGGLLRLVQK
ncbi:MAG TPA: hypothetical protein PK490_15405 [Prosthecobacter sp.]|nr:hypothetical protein [Prosthecobacter sp.]HRK15667.1 hypothetical protein [Prosthecobacter sp.]